MMKTAKLTITVPRELINLADEVAKEKKISRSKVVTACLEELAEKRRAADMAEGYKAMAKENLQAAALSSEMALEVLPEWK